MAVLRMVCISFLLVGLVGSIQTADAQIGSRLKKRAKDRVEQKVGEKQDKVIDEAFDGSEESAEEAEDTAEPAGSSESTAASASGSKSAGPAANLRPGEGAWANYDFIPGERALFVDDFTGDVVGNFPQRLEFKSGNMEIVDWQGKRWLRGDGGEFFINLSETLPERFTIEFDLAGSGNAMSIKFAGQPGDSDNSIEIGTYFARARSGEVDGQGELRAKTDEKPVRIQMVVDGNYLKLYANENRALNVPNAKLGRSDRIYFNLNGWSAEDPRMIADLRIMAGGRKLYDALSAEGRVATQGILFDTGSDVIRPESTPTLKEIGEMLKQHSDLKLRIEGHTDNVGNADSNKQLSERRAAAVKAYLASAYGIDATRLETAGMGAEVPVTSNDTPEGRQMNRRVELVRL